MTKNNVTITNEHYETALAVVDWLELDLYNANRAPMRMVPRTLFRHSSGYMLEDTDVIISSFIDKKLEIFDKEKECWVCIK